MLTAPTHPTGDWLFAGPPTRTAVSVRGLRRSYGDVEAVRGIDLEITRGEIFALLGPNGAGKTTTLEILEGFRTRSGGEVEVLGVDPEQGDRAWRERLGMVLQDTLPEPELTVRECLSLYAGYYANPRPVDDTLVEVGLADLAPRRCERLSWSAAQTRRGAGLDRRPRAALPRRAHNRLRPRRPASDVGPRRSASVRRYNDRADHSLHGGGRAARRPNRRDRRRPDRRRGHSPRAGRAKPHDRRDHLHDPARRSRRRAAGALGAVGIDESRRARINCEDPVAAMFSLTRWALEHEQPLPDLQLRRPTLEDVYLHLTADA
ncbi:MAG: ABC transporter ATP-binding protein [Solirubrobacterales bacterium]|nr:ABC transporter ATP-binding protein [Solirubrobacterales bacterium]